MSAQDSHAAPMPEAHPRRADAEIVQDDAGTGDLAGTAAVAAADLLGDIVDLLAHDLRSPLGSILMWARILRQAPQGAPDAATALEMIERSTASMVASLEELSASRTALKGALTGARQPLDLAALLASIAGARGAYEAPGPGTDHEDAPARGFVLADPKALRLGIEHLITGLLLESPEGARVGWQQVSSEQDERFASWLISAIAPDALVAPEHATSRRAALQVRIAARIVELQGGCLESHEGALPSATLRLPAGASMPSRES